MQNDFDKNNIFTPTALKQAEAEQIPLVLKEGNELNIKGFGIFKVVRVRQNGKITMKPLKKKA